MRGPRTDITDLTGRLRGKSVSLVAQPDPRRVEVHFTDGFVLTVALLRNRLALALTGSRDRRGSGPQPTGRQREYLEFIARYIRRYGVSPAESDIARHFFLSGPSVNRMIQMLEQRRFIVRRRGVPRSITIVDRRLGADGATRRSRRGSA